MNTNSEFAPIEFKGRCIGVCANGEHCTKFPLQGRQLCETHETDRTVFCSTPKCRAKKIGNGLEFCHNCAPKDDKGQVIGIGLLPLNTTGEVLDALRDVANNARIGKYNAQVTAALTSLLGKIYDALVKREAADPKNVVRAALVGESARVIASKLTLDQARIIAQNRSPHLVAKIVHDFEVDETEGEITETKKLLTVLEDDYSELLEGV